MYVNKNFSLRNVLRFSGHHTLLFGAWVLLVTVVHEIFHHSWMAIPWLPISIIGTAVAFYVGFKNNQAYDRLWEARKIWGGIINSSRSWGTMVNSFLTNHFTTEKLSDKEIHHYKTLLVHRHIAWLYALRSQLLVPTSWEHISQGKWAEKSTIKRMKNFGVGLVDDHNTKDKLIELLQECNYDKLINYTNTATQIIDLQSQLLQKLRGMDMIEDFRHMELQSLLTEFYTLQGKCERIKKFPLPRQYAYSSFVFTLIFLVLLPFGMVTEFHKLGEAGAWLSIPFTIIVGWVFIMMELVGDYSENPFEGLGNDIPMLSLTRVIEIDLKEMLGEDNIPESIKAINGILM